MEQEQSLEKTIHSDLASAMKNRAILETGTLRMLIAAINAKVIEKRGCGNGDTLTEEEVIGVISKEAKKRKESSVAFLSGGRKDLADKEDAERAVIEKYLPPRATEEDINVAILESINSVNPQSMKDFGKVVGESLKRLHGSADASEISLKIKDKLSQMFS